MSSSADAHTNSMSSAATNHALRSTIGAKPKTRFFGPERTPMSTKRLKSLSLPRRQGVVGFRPRRLTR